jgi:hypothetical protein
MSKRNREVQIQAWFDPEDPSEGFVLSMFEHMQRVYGDTKKQSIYRAMYALNMMLEQDMRIAVPPSQSRQTKMILEIRQAIEALTQMVKSGGTVVAGGDDAQMILKNAAWSMNELERGIADSYQPMDLGDDDET